MMTDDDMNAQPYGTVKPYDPTNGILTPQTATNFASQPPPQPKEDAPLPMVPRGQLAEWIKAHQNEEQQAVPSGVPSADDQQRADIARGFGNARANILAGAQSTIGILKPGSANYDQANMIQKQGEQQAQQILARAPQARNEAVQNMQLGAMQDEKRQKQMQMIQALKQQQDIRDPASQETIQAKNAMLDRLKTYATVTQNPALKERLTNMMAMVSDPTMTAERLDKIDKSGDMVKLLGFESNERAAGNANQVKEDIAKGTLAVSEGQLQREWAKQLQDEKDKLLALTDKKNGASLRIIGQQPATITDIGKTALSLKQLGEVKALIKGGGSDGKLNPNIVKSAIETGEQIIPWGDPDPKYLEFWGKTQQINQQLRLAMEKTVKNNPYMATLLDKMLIKPTDNAKTILIKIHNMEPQLRETLGSKVGELRVDPETGQPIDKSVLAQHLAGETGIDADELLSNYLGKPQAAPVKVPVKKAPPTPGTIIIQGGKRYQIQPDGSGKELK